MFIDFIFGRQHDLRPYPNALSQRRGGRKRIVSPDGSALVPTSKPQPDGILVKAVARSWRWQRMLDAGVSNSVSDIGDAENISTSYVSRVLRLALLAPDIVEAIVAGSRSIRPASSKAATMRFGPRRAHHAAAVRS